MKRRDFIDAKVENFSKDLPHDVFIPENHLQAISMASPTIKLSK